jgi:hypothetical protein
MLSACQFIDPITSQVSSVLQLALLQEASSRIYTRGDDLRNLKATRIHHTGRKSYNQQTRHCKHSRRFKRSSTQKLEYPGSRFDARP